MAELRTARITAGGYEFDGRQGDAGELARYAGDAPLRLLVPAEDVLLTTVEIPARSRRDRLRAVPFALEERVCAEAGSLHYALGDPLPGGALPVAVVARHCMDAWLEPLAATGVTVASVLPDCLALPCESGTWHLRADAGRILLRTGPASGCAMDRDAAADLLRRLLKEAAPGTLRLDADAGLVGFETIAREYGWTVDSAPAPGGGSAAMGPAVPDLRQGRYAPPGRARGWRAWRVAAGLLAASLALHVGLSYTRATTLEAQARAARAANEATFRRLFPGTKRIVDMRLQAAQQLEKLRAARTGSDAFLRMFLASGEALNTVPGKSLTEISYAHGVLDLGLVVADLSLLEQYAQRLATRRLRAEVLGATRRDDGVAGRVRIRELPP